jgi:hypothetical protein
MPSTLTKRPCRECRRWFVPDSRAGGRQHTCDRDECQAKRRAKTQASWRKRNPECFIGRRLDRLPEAEADPPRVSTPLNRLPWILAQDQFGVQGAGFLGAFGRLLVIRAKDQMTGHPAGITNGSPQVAPGAQKDQRRAVPG